MANPSWFQRHINITLVLGYLVSLLIGNALAFVLNNAWALLWLVPWVAVIIWAIKMKGRSMWWVLPSILIGIIPLLLGNKRIAEEK